MMMKWETIIKNFKVKEILMINIIMSNIHTKFLKKIILAINYQSIIINLDNIRWGITIIKAIKIINITLKTIFSRC